MLRFVGLLPNRGDLSSGALVAMRFPSGMLGIITPAHMVVASSAGCPISMAGGAVNTSTSAHSISLSDPNSESISYTYDVAS